MFFSVKKLIKIDGKIYRPCVCYPVTETIKSTILSLAKSGKVYTFEEKVFFQNGKALKTPSELKEEKREAKRAERKAKKELSLTALEVPEL